MKRTNERKNDSFVSSSSTSFLFWRVSLNDFSIWFLFFSFVVTVVRFHLHLISAASSQLQSSRSVRSSRRRSRRPTRNRPPTCRPMSSHLFRWSVRMHYNCPKEYTLLAAMVPPLWCLCVQVGSCFGLLTSAIDVQHMKEMQEIATENKKNNCTLEWNSKKWIPQTERIALVKQTAKQWVGSRPALTHALSHYFFFYTHSLAHVTHSVDVVNH